MMAHPRLDGGLCPTLMPLLDCSELTNESADNTVSFLTKFSAHFVNYVFFFQYLAPITDHTAGEKQEKFG